MRKLITIKYFIMYLIFALKINTNQTTALEKKNYILKTRYDFIEDIFDIREEFIKYLKKCDALILDEIESILQDEFGLKIKNIECYFDPLLLDSTINFLNDLKKEEHNILYYKKDAVVILEKLKELEEKYFIYCVDRKTLSLKLGYTKIYVSKAQNSLRNFIIETLISSLNYYSFFEKESNDKFSCDNNLKELCTNKINKKIEMNDFLFWLIDYGTNSASLNGRNIKYPLNYYLYNDDFIENKGISIISTNLNIIRNFILEDDVVNAIKCIELCNTYIAIYFKFWTKLTFNIFQEIESKKILSKYITKYLDVLVKTENLETKIVATMKSFENNIKIFSTHILNLENHFSVENNFLKIFIDSNIYYDFKNVISITNKDFNIIIEKNRRFLENIINKNYNLDNFNQEKRLEFFFYEMESIMWDIQNNFRKIQIFSYKFIENLTKNLLNEFESDHNVNHDYLMTINKSKSFKIQMKNINFHKKSLLNLLKTWRLKLDEFFPIRNYDNKKNTMIFYSSLKYYCYLKEGILEGIKFCLLELHLTISTYLSEYKDIKDLVESEILDELKILYDFMQDHHKKILLDGLNYDKKILIDRIFKEGFECIENFSLG